MNPAPLKLEDIYSFKKNVSKSSEADRSLTAHAPYAKTGHGAVKY
jgi:hypothetical protein